MGIGAVAFDADGVIQRRPLEWKAALGEILGFSGEPGEFLAAVFAAEDLALNGQCDFRGRFSSVLSRWSCRATLEHALHVWTTIKVRPEITDVIRSLSRSDITCYLASNQEAYKAAYMSTVLGYCDLFEKEFYSCWLGLVKPREAYFRAMLSEIALPANGILFIDDREINVDAARAVGLHAATFQLDSGQNALERILRDHGIATTGEG